jgi:hypothetical protein
MQSDVLARNDGFDFGEGVGVGKHLPAAGYATS